MKLLTPEESQLAEMTARVIAKAEEAGLPDPPHKLGIPDHAICLLARAHIALCGQIRALHDLVDPTNPADPVGAALTKIALAERPQEWSTGPRLVLTPTKIETLSADELLALYCGVMGDVREVFVKYATYIVRQWDGMDGCWTDCTGDIGREEALRVWASRTDGGTRNVSYAEIDYYRIFPGGSRMHWDGSEGRELHR